MIKGLSIVYRGPEFSKHDLKRHEQTQQIVFWISKFQSGQPRLSVDIPEPYKLVVVVSKSPIDVSVPALR